ncbi:MAG: hypothetical protein EBT52_03885 [Flavobacteriia bacterium]|nr:hypothetical protein [Flavobacteriia bacterium]
MPGDKEEEREEKEGRDLLQPDLPLTQASPFYGIDNEEKGKKNHSLRFGQQRSNEEEIGPEQAFAFLSTDVAHILQRGQQEEEGVLHVLAFSHPGITLDIHGMQLE